MNLNAAMTKIRSKPDLYQSHTTHSATKPNSSKPNLVTNDNNQGTIGPGPGPASARNSASSGKKSNQSQKSRNSNKSKPKTSPNNDLAIPNLYDHDRVRDNENSNSSNDNLVSDPTLIALSKLREESEEEVVEPQAHDPAATASFGVHAKVPVQPAVVINSSNQNSSDGSDEEDSPTAILPNIENEVDDVDDDYIDPEKTLEDTEITEETENFGEITNVTVTSESNINMDGSVPTAMIASRIVTDENDIKQQLQLKVMGSQNDHDNNVDINNSTGNSSTGTIRIVPENVTAVLNGGAQKQSVMEDKTNVVYEDTHSEPDDNHNEQPNLNLPIPESPKITNNVEKNKLYPRTSLELDDGFFSSPSPRTARQKYNDNKNNNSMGHKINLSMNNSGSFAAKARRKLKFKGSQTENMEKSKTQKEDVKHNVGQPVDDSDNKNASDSSSESSDDDLDVTNGRAPGSLDDILQGGLVQPVKPYLKELQRKSNAVVEGSEGEEEDGGSQISKSESSDSENENGSSDAESDLNEGAVMDCTNDDSENELSEVTANNNLMKKQNLNSSNINNLTHSIRSNVVDPNDDLNDSEIANNSNNNSRIRSMFDDDSDDSDDFSSFGRPLMKGQKAGVKSSNTKNIKSKNNINSSLKTKSTQKRNSDAAVTNTSVTPLNDNISNFELDLRSQQGGGLEGGISLLDTPLDDPNFVGQKRPDIMARKPRNLSMGSCQSQQGGTSMSQQSSHTSVVGNIMNNSVTVNTMQEQISQSVATNPRLHIPAVSGNSGPYVKRTTQLKSPTSWLRRGSTTQFSTQQEEDQNDNQQYSGHQQPDSDHDEPGVFTSNDVIEGNLERALQASKNFEREEKKYYQERERVLNSNKPTATAPNDYLNSIGSKYLPKKTSTSPTFQTQTQSQTQSQTTSTGNQILDRIEEAKNLCKSLNNLGGSQSHSAARTPGATMKTPLSINKSSGAKLNSQTKSNLNSNSKLASQNLSNAMLSQSQQKLNSNIKDFTESTVQSQTDDTIEKLSAHVNHFTDVPNPLEQPSLYEQGSKFSIDTIKSLSNDHHSNYQALEQEHKRILEWTNRCWAKVVAEQYLEGEKKLRELQQEISGFEEVTEKVGEFYSEVEKEREDRKMKREKERREEVQREEKRQMMKEIMKEIATSATFGTQTQTTLINTINNQQTLGNISLTVPDSLQLNPNLSQLVSGDPQLELEAKLLESSHAISEERKINATLKEELKRYQLKASEAEKGFLEIQRESGKDMSDARKKFDLSLRSLRRDHASASRQLHDNLRALRQELDNTRKQSETERKQLESELQEERTVVHSLELELKEAQQRLVESQQEGKNQISMLEQEVRKMFHKNSAQQDQNLNADTVGDSGQGGLINREEQELKTLQQETLAKRSYIERLKRETKLEIEKRENQSKRHEQRLEQARLRGAVENVRLHINVLKPEAGTVDQQQQLNLQKNPLIEDMIESNEPSSISLDQHPCEMIMPQKKKISQVKSSSRRQSEQSNQQMQNQNQNFITSNSTRNSVVSQGHLSQNGDSVKSSKSNSVSKKRNNSLVQDESVVSQQSSRKSEKSGRSSRKSVQSQSRKSERKSDRRSGKAESNTNLNSNMIQVSHEKRISRKSQPVTNANDDDETVVVESEEAIMINLPSSNDLDKELAKNYNTSTKGSNCNHEGSRPVSVTSASKPRFSAPKMSTTMSNTKPSPMNSLAGSRKGSVVNNANAFAMQYGVQNYQGTVM